MRKFTTKNKLGFSLLELMVVVAIIGVLATFAVPRFNIFRARARQGEAKSNLGVIFTLQEAFKIDKELYYNGDSSHWGGDQMNSSASSVGYRTVAGVAGVCGANKLGFRLANCNAARYRYWIEGAGENVFLAVAAAHSDTPDKRIFPGCEGTATAKKVSTSDSTKKCFFTAGVPAAPPSLAVPALDPNVAKGDAFCLDHERVIDNFKDIVSDPDCDD